ncbi:hypothetical protein ACIA5G_51180 [Amycolatopsis sp. NPDC051758]|uniref:hypothetical protein n=1 Tax=Amycolatopsis sp. NPDC051758 TaxID=3363935 RepID=UPI003795975A
MSEQSDEQYIRGISSDAAGQASAGETRRPPTDLTAAVEGRKRAQAELDAQRGN